MQRKACIAVKLDNTPYPHYIEKGVTLTKETQSFGCKEDFVLRTSIVSK